MSEGNAATVREIFQHLNRGDIEGVVGLCADDFVIDMTGRVFNPDTYEGHEGVRRFYAGVSEAWETYLWDVEETRVTGDVVVALLHCRGQSREGGPGVDWRVAWLWRFRGGKAAYVRFYRERAKALLAAGLSE